MGFGGCSVSDKTLDTVGNKSDNSIQLVGLHPDKASGLQSSNQLLQQDGECALPNLKSKW